MKYILLAYTGQAEWAATDDDSPELAAMCTFYEDLGAELTASGELVMTEGLADPSFTRTVRLEAGEPVALDGPYAEAKEVLASFAIVDVESHDRALAIAARITAGIGDAIEVRPVGAGPSDAASG